MSHIITSGLFRLRWGGRGGPQCRHELLQHRRAGRHPAPAAACRQPLRVEPMAEVAHQRKQCSWTAAVHELQQLLVPDARQMPDGQTADQQTAQAHRHTKSDH